MKKKNIAPAGPKYPITHNGKVVSCLNAALVERRNISPENVAELLKSHSFLCQIYEQMESTDDKRELRGLAKVVEQIEFKQQRLWGFPEDASYHNWYDVPKCTCPKLDNADAKGVPGWNIVDVQCPIHGSDVVEAIDYIVLDTEAKLLDAMGTRKEVDVFTSTLGYDRPFVVRVPAHA